MSWRAITEDDYLGSVNSAEDTTIRAGMLAVAQGDPFLTNTQLVTGYFRNAIRSGPGNKLSPDETTLPEAAIFHAVAMLRYRLMTRFAAELVTDDHRTGKKDAEIWLKEVRRGFEKIEQPDDEPGETHSSQIEVSENVPPREWTRRQQRGL
jgi:hypothetical protein